MTTTRPPNRRTVGSTLFTLGACGLILVVLGCPTGPIPPGNGNGNGNDNDNTGPPATKQFAGADACSSCHADKHADWDGTAHADALEALIAIGQGENEECLGCHTVGFGAGGFVSLEDTPEFAGVQCENCHGSALEHTANPGDASLRPDINMSSTVCGECHTDAHHPTFDEWELSKHAMALEGLTSSGFAQDTCLECHSQDYRFAIEEGEEPPTIETAELSIECATCHAPHGGVAQEHQLRAPVAALCGECHTVEEATLGDSPHHPQIEMLGGEGAFAEDGSALGASFSPHASLIATTACAQCHVVEHELEDPDDVTPNVTGHTFNPFDEEITAVSPEHQPAQFAGCAMCHDAAGAESRKTNVQTQIEGRLADLAPFFDSADPQFIDPETLSAADQERLSVAKFNFQFVNADGSRGVHNSFYSRLALDIAESIVNDLSP